MKRLILAIFALAIFVGVFAPITADFAPDAGISVQPARVEAQTIGGALVQVNAASANAATTFLTNNVLCGVSGFGSFAQCIIWIVYYIPYTFGGYILTFTAWMFDQMAGATLSSTYYTAPFISDGWKLIRDFSNVFFILILLFIALSLVLDLEIGHADPKRMLASVILIAVIINFSFFITEVVIDISNSLALVFYNQITVTTTSGTGASTTQTTQTGATKSISQALAQGFTPQVMQSADFWNGLGQPLDPNSIPVNGALDNFLIKFGSVAAPKTHLATATVNLDTQGAAIVIAVLLLVGSMYCIAAYVFVVATLSFIGRVISLWIAIIFSPFAFISYVVPETRHMENFGWTSWWAKLIEAAFSAPIFFFFLLLISLMMKSPFVNPQYIAANGSWAALLVITVTMIFFIYLMLMAVKYVKKASGEIGQAVTKVTAFVGGVAVGTVAGAVAVGGSKFIGGTASRALASERLHERAAGINAGKFSQWVAKKQIGLYHGATKSSFDVRQHSLAGKVSELTGMGFGSVGIFSTKNTAGGHSGHAAREAQKHQEIIDKFKTRQKHKENLQNTSEARQDEIDNTEKLLKAAQEKSRAVRNAQENFRLAKLGLLKDASGTLIGVPAAEALVRAAVDEAKDARQQITALQDKINKLSHGEFDKDTGKQLLYDNMRYTTEHKDAKGNWVAGATKKADGTPVTAQNVLDNLNASTHVPKTVRTESLSMAQLKTLHEDEEKVLARAYIHSVNKNTGHDTHVIYDKLGNVKESHLKSQQGARNLGRAFKEVMTSAAVGGVLGTAFGSIIPGIGNIVTGASGALVMGLTRAVKEMSTRKNSVAAEAAHMLEAKAPSHGHAPTTNYTYKSEIGKIFNFGGGGGGHAGGGGHGDGGHGGGHGGH